MSKLEGYNPAEKKRIVNIAAKLVEGLVERGSIPCTEEAIRAAMPQAIEDAKQAVTAADEYLCG